MLYLKCLKKVYFFGQVLQVHKDYMVHLHINSR